MSNRFHNKFHKHNHHTRSTDRSGLFPDSAYDPIASPDSPFEGEFFVDGDVTSMSAISAGGDLYASDGFFHGNVRIEGNLDILGETTRQDTLVIITSALEVTNTGLGPALKVTQTGVQPLAWFIDNNGDDVVIDNNGYVGLGTMNPNEKLTIVGNLSSVGNNKTEGELTVAKNTYFFSNNYLSGSGYVRENFSVNTDVLYVDSTTRKIGVNTKVPNLELTVIGNISGSNSVFIDRDATIKGNEYVSGSSWLSGSKYIQQSLFVDETAFVVDSVLNRIGINTRTPNETLTIVGGISATNNIVSQQNAFLSGNALVKGYQTVGGYQMVGGSVFVSGSEIIDGTLKVNTLNTGATNYVATHDGNTITTREANYRIWDTTAEFVSANNLQPNNIPRYGSFNRLSVSPIQINDSSNTTTVSTKLSVQNDTNITGNLSAGGTLFAGGDATLQKILKVEGNLSAWGDTTLIGNVSAGNNLVVQNNITTRNNLSAINDLFIGNDVRVKGNVTFAKTLSVADLITGKSSITWYDTTTKVQTLSVNWNLGYNSYTTVNAFSANWDDAYEFVDALNYSSLDWNKLHTVVALNSAQWDAAYQQTGAGLAEQNNKINSVYGNVNGLSANWNSVYTNVQSNSGQWAYLTDRVDDLTEALSLAAGIGTGIVSLIGSANIVNYNVQDYTTLYHAQSATGPFILNIRADDNISLNNFLQVNQSISIRFVNNNGAIARQLYALQVDGKFPTISFKDGSSTAFPASNANSNDLWTFTIIKTANEKFTVLADVVKLIPVQRTQVGLTLSGEAAGDEFGASVALNSSGDIVAVGARLNDGSGTNAGSVRVFYWEHTGWGRMGSVDIDGLAAADQFGISVSLNAAGNILAVGAIENDGGGTNSGSVRVFQYNSGTSSWNLLGTSINGETANDKSGCSVSLNQAGTRVAIGASFNDGGGADAGSARVYQWNGTAWVQMGSVDIDGEAAGDEFGISVSLNGAGDRLAVGARYNDGSGTNAGSARVYQWNSTNLTWTRMGSVDLDGEAAADQSGFSVSLNAAGDILAIGAPLNDGSGADAGHVRVYQWDSEFSVWEQLGVDVDGELAGDQSGFSVSLNAAGDILAIGAPLNDGSASNAGQLRMYEWNSENGIRTWVRMNTDNDGLLTLDEYGYSVAVNSTGQRVAIGARLGDAGGLVNNGSVRVFDVYPNAPYPPGKILLTNQPSSQQLEVNQPVSLSVSAQATSGGTLSYLWVKNGISTGITTTTYSYNPSVLGQDKIKCIVKNNTYGTTAVTQLATISITAPIISIVTQPTSTVTVKQGVAFTLSVAAAVNSGNLSYQWYEDGNEVGTNSPTLTLTRQTITSNPLQIYCIVTGQYGSTATSNTSNVNIIASIPIITSQPSNITKNQGDFATFTIGAYVESGIIAYQWKKNGINVGTNSSTLSIAEDNIGSYSITCVVSNSTYGNVSVTSNVVTFTVTTAVVTIVTNPFTATRQQGVNATFIAGGTTAAGELAYQWKINDIALVDDEDTSGATTETLILKRHTVGSSSITCTITNTTYNVAATTTAANFIVTAAVITITSQPASITRQQGVAATFSVTASTPVNGLNYQWKVNGVNVGINSPTYTVEDTILDVVGTYNVVCQITHARYTEVTLNTNTATLQVTTAVVTITSHPSSATKAQGYANTFSIAATTAAGELSYQWKLNGEDVVANNSPTYTVLLYNLGTYNITCTVTNTKYNVSSTSNTAVLTIVDAVVYILAQPVRVIARGPGQIATFGIAAYTNNGTLTYQWYNSDNVAVTNESNTNTAYSISSNTVAISSVYCVVRNSYGPSATSEIGKLISSWSFPSTIWSLVLSDGPTNYTADYDYFRDIAYGASKWVTVGAEGFIKYSSNNGDTWTATATNVFLGNDVNAITYKNGIFMAVGGGGNIHKSADGVSWTACGSLPGSGSKNLLGANYSSGTWIVFSTDSIWTSTNDGASWTSRGITYKNLHSIATDGSGTWVVVPGGIGNNNDEGQANYISYDNGVTWSQLDMNIGNSYNTGTAAAAFDVTRLSVNKVIYYAPTHKRWYYAVDEGNIWQSSNAIDWLNVVHEVDLINARSVAEAPAGGLMFAGQHANTQGNNTLTYVLSVANSNYNLVPGFEAQNSRSLFWPTVNSSIYNSRTEAPSGANLGVKKIVYGNGYWMALEQPSYNNYNRVSRSPVVGAVPVITSQPSNVSVSQSNPGTFNVTATTSTGGTLSYQWYKNEVAVGTNSSSVTIAETNIGTHTIYCAVLDSVTKITTYSNTVTLNVTQEPITISSQPVSISRVQGVTGSFSVTATTEGALFYQWRRNGTNISGATSSSYTVATGAETTVGTVSYDCVISNTYGTVVTSNAATLTVTAAAITISSQPSSLTREQGVSATFSVTATSAGSYAISYQWRRNGTDISGATSSSYTVTETVAGTYNYDCVLTNLYGNAVTTSTAVLTINLGITITSQPASLTRQQNVSASFSVTATTTSGTLSYQWRLNGTNISGATSSSYTVTQTTVGTYNYTCVITNASKGASITTNTAVLTVDAAAVTISSQPASISRVQGVTGTFSVTASTTFGTLSYQWRRNGTDISGATSSSYTVPANTETTVGTVNYVCVITNATAGTSATTNVAVLTITAATITISVQPASASIGQGAARTLTVTATSAGSYAISYQWKENGVNVGTNSASYTIPAGSKTVVGSTFTYTCVLTNQYGNSVTTNDAVITIIAATINITSQPSSVTRQQNVSASFSVTATTTFGTLSYQWRLDGTNISGATSSSYTVTQTTVGTYNYDCVITNATAGTSATTNVAVLTITAATITISSQPASISRVQGVTGTFSVTASTTFGTLSYQWRRNGTNISGATSSSYTVPANTETIVGTTVNYDCVITNATAGTSATTNVAVLTITAATITISSQPASVNVTQGVAQTLSVTAASAGGYAITYQWKENGVNVGTNSASYTIPAGTKNTVGSTFTYTCVLTNQYGNSVTSSEAVVTIIIDVITITSQPASVSAPEGSAPMFTVIATSTGGTTLTYQWKEDDIVISGATDSTYVVPLNTKNTVGATFTYTCAITNAYGNVNVTSNGAVLTIVSGGTISVTTSTTTNIPNYFDSFTQLETSADGTYMEIITPNAYDGRIWKSADGGSTWTEAGIDYWIGHCMSSDGKIRYYSKHGVDGAGFISRDFGATKTYTHTVGFQVGVICAGDGDHVMQGTYGSPGPYYYPVKYKDGFQQTSPSTYPGTWNDNNSFSEDGKIQLFIPQVGRETTGPWVSRDYGVTWTTITQATLPAGAYWTCSSVSGKGDKMVLGASGGQVWVSSDTGATWTQVLGTERWSNVHMSKDGSTIVAAISYTEANKQIGGTIQYSKDFGNTWFPLGAVSGAGWWNRSIKLNSNGSKVYAVSNKGNFLTLNVNAGAANTPSITIHRSYRIHTTDTSSGIGAPIYRVHATSSATISYQWKKDGVNVGTNSRTFTPADKLTGNYTCEVTDSAGGSVTASTFDIMTSTVRLLSVKIGGVKEVGAANPQFTVSADVNIGGFSYQWKRNGVDISGATNYYYTPTDNTVGEYEYSCVVTGTYGESETAKGTLSVVPAHAEGTSVTISYLVLAGGAGGSKGRPGDFCSYGSGGAGGYIVFNQTTPNFPTNLWDSVSIGAGGTTGINPTVGADTSIVLGGTTYTAIGGGVINLNGGSSGGRRWNEQVLPGIPGQGHPGGRSGNDCAVGGGGGAATRGQVISYIGNGFTENNETITYGAAGGAGHTWLDGTARGGGGGGIFFSVGRTALSGAPGGFGGGGSGVSTGPNNQPGSVLNANGEVNKGAGGGAGLTGSGAGSSGTIAVRYKGTASKYNFPDGGVTTTITGGFVYHYVTSSAVGAVKI